MWDVERQITSHRQLSKTVCHIMLTSDQMWSMETDRRADFLALITPQVGLKDNAPKATFSHALEAQGQHLFL